VGATGVRLGEEDTPLEEAFHRLPPLLCENPPPPAGVCRCRAGL
jgi:hypothetical protein